ncbi:MAG: DUF268 domain-containing protein, partial [Bacteroidia bacterium]|nr:DUF268 domain-containing protein [Bacteroidia bacterium]
MITLNELRAYIKSKRAERWKLKLLKQSFDTFNQLDSIKKLSNSWDSKYPCLNDNTGTTPFDAHYIYHPAWAARIIKEINPEKHLDISSTLHFCTILSAFVKTEFYDYRPALLTLSNLKSTSADLTNLFFESNSVDSISCMHTIEHVGLGRYGDKIDPDGDFKAIAELQRVVKAGGSLLIVVPVGKPKIMFNAHRIYSFELINDLFTNFELRNFSLIDDSGNYLENADKNLVANLS